MGDDRDVQGIMPSSIGDSPLPSGDTEVAANGSDISIQPSTNVQPSASQNEELSSKGSGSQLMMSSADAVSSGHDDETASDSNFDTASLPEDVDIFDAEIQVARAANVVYVGSAREVEISESTSKDSEVTPVGLTEAPEVRPGQAQLAEVQSSGILRRSRSGSASARPSRHLPAPAAPPTLNQPLASAPAINPVDAYHNERRLRRMHGLRRDELHDYLKQRQIDEDAGYRTNIDRTNDERKQLRKSKSSPQLYMVPISDGGGPRAGLTGNKSFGTLTQTVLPSSEYEQSVRRMGNMSSLNALLRSTRDMPPPPIPARLRPIRPLPSSSSFPGLLSTSSTTEPSRGLHSSCSTSGSPSRPGGSPGGPSRRSPRHSPPSNMARPDAHRLSIVPESVKNEEEAENNSEDDPFWARALAEVQKRQADARFRIRQQIRFFVHDDATVNEMIEFILVLDDDEIEACARGPTSYNTVKRKVENLKIAFAVLKGDIFGAHSEDLQLLVQARLKRKVKALVEKWKAEEAAAQDKGKGEGKENDLGGRRHA
ncbi:hypothetical protein F5Y13DRAFT_206718 [Hypoxylon sp. FL1857]|nr:hypothetical protein F5Y13DRAFT_206718 [Hypoxylon sp. FL1857]